jgi:thioredoxin 1
MKLTDDTFKNNIENSTHYILVKFETDWCAPCNTLSAILIEVENELKDKIKFCTMNIEDNPEISSRLAIRSIPTMILFKDGKPIGSKSGVQSKEDIIDWINRSIT